MGQRFSKVKPPSTAMLAATLNGEAEAETFDGRHRLVCTAKFPVPATPDQPARADEHSEPNNANNASGDTVENGTNHTNESTTRGTPATDSSIGTLTIETFPPAPSTRAISLTPIGLTARSPSTAILEQFRAIHTPLAPDALVEEFLVNYLALHAAAQDGRPLDQPTAEWVIGAIPPHGTAPQRVRGVQLLMECSHEGKAEAVGRLKELRLEVVEQCWVVAASVRNMVPNFTEWLLEALALVSDEVHSVEDDSATAVRQVQTASRAQFEWKADQNTKAVTHDLRRSRASDVANKMINDIDISETTMGRIVNAAFVVLNGCAVYSRATPWSLTHLSTACARVLLLIRNVKDPEVRVHLLEILFDALALGLSGRTPGLVGLWVDAKIAVLDDEDVARVGAADLHPVFAAVREQLVAVELCILRLTSKGDTLLGPNPAILRRLLAIQHARGETPAFPKRSLDKQSAIKRAEGMVTIQSASPPAHAIGSSPGHARGGDDTTGSSDYALCGLYALTQHPYSSELANALAAHVRVVPVVALKKKGFRRRTVATGGMEEFHLPPVEKAEVTEMVAVGPTTA